MKQNFTLLELLVVISVIMILVGILLPVLGRSRAQGRSAACLSNLKQIGSAYLAYSSDFGATVKIWSSSSCRWMDSLSVYLGGSLPKCSGDRRPEHKNSPSYGITSILSAGGDPDNKGFNLWYNVSEKKITNPSQFITVSGVSDSYFLGDGTDSAAVTGILNGESAVTGGFCKNLSFRHGAHDGSFQAALADGHVEKFRFNVVPDKFFDLKNRGGYGGRK